MTDSIQTLASLVLGSVFIGSTMYAINQLETKDSLEFFGADVQAMRPVTRQPMSQQQQMSQQMTYPQNPMFYVQNNRSNVQDNSAFGGPSGSIPQSQANINLSTSGDQMLAYQLYQQAVNAATPTLQQLNSISGESQQQTGRTDLHGGVSSEYAPYNMSGGSADLYSSEYQAVNLGNARADQISACAQNAPTFVATSLLPKPGMPGVEGFADAWDTNAPSNILANQNFLSATQQLGVDTVLSSLRNPSYDLRNSIANPINLVSPWNMSTITPDLERRPLDTFIPSNGLYGPGPEGLGINDKYVGRGD
jgi:hypothetical protein